MSNSKFVLTDFAVKKLTETVDLSGFDCSDGDGLGLNEFLHKQALDYQKEAMGTTHLFYYKEDLIGYVTISMGSINVKSTRLKLNFYDDKVRYPALLLGRVGVDNYFRKRGVGRCMCKWAIGFAQELSVEIGCRFVVLATKDESRIKFYTNCGFEMVQETKVKKKKRRRDAKKTGVKDIPLTVMYVQIF